MTDNPNNLECAYAILCVLLNFIRSSIMAEGSGNTSDETSAVYTVLYKVTWHGRLLYDQSTLVDYWKIRRQSPSEIRTININLFRWRFQLLFCHIRWCHWKFTCRNFSHCPWRTLSLFLDCAVTFENGCSCSFAAGKALHSYVAAVLFQTSH